MKPLLVLRSPLAPEEAEEALRAALAAKPRPGWGVPPVPRAEAIAGTVGGGRIHLHYRAGMRNSASPVFRGRLLPDGYGSRLEGRFGVPRLVLVVMAFIAYFLLGLAGMGVALVVLGDEEPEGGAWKGFLFIGLSIGFALIARLVWVFCRRMAEGEEEVLRRFLTLHLRIPEGGPAATPARTTPGGPAPRGPPPSRGA